MCAESQSPVKKLRVAACRNEDLLEVQAILKSSPGAAAWSAAGLADTLSRYPSYFLLAWHNEQMAGFIAGRRVADEGEILNLAVVRSCRHQGIGKMLVEALLEVFVRERVVEVFLEVRESNLGAITFYESMGFYQVGIRPRYYQNPVEAALLLTVSTHSRASNP